MANTYTQIHIQLVFAVKHRAGLIQKVWKDDLYKYITGIIQGNSHKLLIINGMALRDFYFSTDIESLTG